MLAFLDESGDAGRKLDKGSSPFFTVALVIFNDHDEALRCEERIGLLRSELGLPSRFEFHFRDDSHKRRLAFLQAVSPYDFFYHAFVLNKDPAKLWGPSFNHKESLYKYVCGLVFENAKPHLHHAIVTIDGSGDRPFRQQLEAYLKRRSNEPGGREVISKVKMQRSASNTLIQLADYVAGAVNRHAMGKKGAEEYRKWISAREVTYQVWPK
jgi:hypothetical protein